MPGQVVFWGCTAGIVGIAILVDRIIKSRDRGVVRPQVVINWRKPFAAHQTTAPDDLEAPFQGGGAAYISTEEARIVPFQR